MLRTKTVNLDNAWGDMAQESIFDIPLEATEPVSAFLSG